MKKRKMVSGILFLMIFVLFTCSLGHIDVKPIGPNGAMVGYARVNQAMHDFFGVHWAMYTLTDWAGVLTLLIPLFFAVMGLNQWIKRKSVLKADRDLLYLGAFYGMVVFAYIFFELTVINRRPVLIEGVHEVSYPSSTTLLSLCVLITAIKQAQIRIKNANLRATACVFLGVFAAFLTIARLISGVHWFTDIVGGILLSLSLVLMYSAMTEKRAERKQLSARRKNE